MELRIDFYSKDEMAFAIDFSGRYPFPENQTSELFLFINYTLRQFNNLGWHPIPKTLAGVLISENTINNLSFEKVEIPSVDKLFSSLNYEVSRFLSETKSPTESFQILYALHDEFSFNKSILEILNNDYISKAPRIIPYNGKGKHSFEVNLPPFVMQHQGFGLLGKDVGYYAFHSVLGLIRVLNKKHKGEKKFAKYLYNAARLCSLAYILKTIPSDHVELSNIILKEIGVS